MHIPIQKEYDYNYKYAEPIAPLWLNMLYEDLVFGTGAGIVYLRYLGSASAITHRYDIEYIAFLDQNKQLHVVDKVHILPGTINDNFYLEINDCILLKIYPLSKYRIKTIKRGKNSIKFFHWKESTIVKIIKGNK